MDSVVPEVVADIVSDGDAIIVVNGVSALPGTSIGLRVSSFALGMASPIFKERFAAAAPAQKGEGSPIVLEIAGDSGDAMCILCNILHLQNDKLPVRMEPEMLRRIGYLARDYRCAVAASRATSYWFDRLYDQKLGDLPEIWKVIEAAYLLDEAVFFARFTSLWVLQQPIGAQIIPPVGNDLGAQRLLCDTPRSPW